MARNPLSPLITFAEWTPDLPDLAGSQEILNVLSNGQSYKPLKSLQEVGDALTARPQGAHSFIDSGNTVRVFAGDISKLYQQNGTSWNDVSGTTYTTADDAAWNFVNYGDQVIATNYTNEMQTYTVGVSSAFSNLSGTPPKAKYIAIVNEFVMVANTFDSTDGAVPYRVRWSALGNPDSWTISTATLADLQDLPGDGGECTGLVGSQNYAVIFQRNAIWRADFVGSPAVFTFEKKVSNHGCRAPGSIAAYDNFIYHWGEDGFKVFDGTQAVPVGARKVDRYFKENLDFQFAHRITSAIDPINNLYMVAWPDVSATNGRPNNLLIYNWLDNRWTRGQEAIEYLFTSLSRGYTLEELDTISGSIDALLFSLDSSVWSGGAAYLAGFTANNKLAAFEGSNLAATIDTQEVQLNEDGRTTITSVLPLVDSASTTVAIGTRNRQSETISYSGDVGVESSTGESSSRVNSRFHTLRIKVPAGATWTNAFGAKIRTRPTGQH